MHCGKLRRIDGAFWVAGFDDHNAELHGMGVCIEGREDVGGLYIECFAVGGMNGCECF